MSENERLVELETRVAFQEHTLAELKTLRGLLYADPASEPPPPHY